MSSPATMSGMTESAELVLDYTNVSDNQTQIPVPNSEKVSDEYQEASYLIPKRVLVKTKRALLIIFVKEISTKMSCILISVRITKKALR